MSKYPVTVNPTTEANWFNENVRTEGALLRDEFAGRAMAQICFLQEGNNPESGAIQAYAWADAMMKAREEGNDK
ncbi:hypothetical protein [Rahnella variigena]|uniref:hypothetical protein n=1 Tax=Rahnella variigena TaxID=574964 RepID=UPI001330F1AD|nr:hypothetical protein [Rahnella variigena]